MIRDKWWGPRALSEAAHAIRLATPAHEFFSDPAYKAVREAINVADFATGRPWNRDWEVRLVPQSEGFPDVQLRCGTDVRPFEITEADRERRRRGAEYQADHQAELDNKPEQVIHFDPGEEAQAALVEIQRVLRQKSEKMYRPRPNILVYVNLWGGEPTSLYAHGLEQLYGDSFESAWLLWGHNMFRLWPKRAKIKLR